MAGLISEATHQAAPACPPAVHGTVENALIHALDRFSAVQPSRYSCSLPILPSASISFHPTALAPFLSRSASLPQVISRDNKPEDGTGLGDHLPRGCTVSA